MNSPKTDPKDRKINQLTVELKREKQKVRHLRSILNSISSQINNYLGWSKGENVN